MLAICNAVSSWVKVASGEEYYEDSEKGTNRSSRTADHSTVGIVHKGIVAVEPRMAALVLLMLHTLRLHAASVRQWRTPSEK
jgi:hypothetical protein